MILRRDWKLSWANVHKQTTEPYTLGPGVYEVEQVPNPICDTGTWIVLKGSRVGAARDYLIQWTHPRNRNCNGHNNWITFKGRW